MRLCTSTIAAAVLLLSPISARAASASERLYDQIGDFTQFVAAHATQALASPAVHQLSLNLWMACAAFYLARLFLGMADGAVSWIDAIQAVVTVLVVQAALAGFDVYTTASYNGFVGVGEVLQQGLLGDAAPLTPLFRVMTVVQRVTFESEATFMTFSPSHYVVLFLVLAALMAVMIVMAFLSLWVFWGYTVLKLVGLFLIPFVLFPGLQGWAERWFGLFVSFLAFEVFARIGGSLCCIGILGIFSAYGVDVADPAGAGVSVSVDHWIEVVPLVVFAIVSVIGMWKSVGMASHIFGGGFAVSSALNSFSAGIARRFR